MSNYCVECGGHLAGGHFCPECGQAVAEEQASPTRAEAARVASSKEEAQPRGPVFLRKHPVGVLTVLAVTLAVLGIGAFAVNAQVRTSEQEAAAAQEQAREAAREAEKQRELKKKARAKERKAREDAEQQPDVYVVPAPATPYNGPIDGEWSGTMADGKYTFWLTLSEYGGQVSGELYQRDTRNGEEGVEIVEGYREGEVLYLNGIAWEYGPSDWEYDRIALTLSADGGSFTGTYTCDGCAPSNSMTGRRS